MQEAANMAILDSACTKTVTGCIWRDIYLESLPKEERNKIKRYPGGTNFKFGGETKIRSIEKSEVPCDIAGKKTTILVDVVDSDIPLLLSKPDMQRLGFRLNMENDTYTLEVDGRITELDTASSGHYYLPVNNCEIEVHNVHLAIEEESFDQKKKMIHKLFDSDCEEILNSISEKCEVCERFKRTPCHSVVCLPLATKFNQVVAMGLKQFRPGIYFLHFIDLVTRYSLAKVIRRKSPKVIINEVAMVWLASGLWPPEKFLIDNGGEFANDYYKELTEQFNIEICGTSANSPWQNGICERNHYIVDVCVEKMIEDGPSMKLEVVLAWVVNVKNSMENHDGFSPIQLVLGTNPHLPSVSTNRLPAMENPEKSEAVTKHLIALHAARRAFTKAESSDRIHRALKHKVRVSNEFFCN